MKLLSYYHIPHDSGGVMVDRFESGTVLSRLGYGGKPYHFAGVGNMLYKANQMKSLFNGS